MLLSLVAMFGLTLTNASAQSTTDFVDPTQAEGFESGYARIYSVDFEAMMEASPSAEGIDMDAMMKTVTVNGVTFDSDDNAEAYIDAMNKFAEEPVEGVEINVEDADYGDQANMYSADLSEMMGSDMFMTGYYVREGSTVYAVSVIDSDEDTANETAKNVIEFMLDKDAGDGEVQFNEDGTSTGGVFDVFPTADDADVTNGLLPMTDMDLTNLPASPSIGG